MTGDLGVWGTQGFARFRRIVRIVAWYRVCRIRRVQDDLRHCSNVSSMGRAAGRPDPSNEVAPMVQAHRMQAGAKVFTLDARHPEIGFNALDWIGAFGSTKEEDITAVASWIITDNPRRGPLATISSEDRRCSC